MDRAEPAASGDRIDLAGPHEIAPEDDRVTVAAMWPGRKQIARPDDRSAGASRVTGNAELPFDVCRIDAGSAAGHARDDRRRPQMHEHVPRLPQDDGLVTAHAVSVGDGDRAQAAILDRRSRLADRPATRC